MKIQELFESGYSADKTIFVVNKNSSINISDFKTKYNKIPEPSEVGRWRFRDSSDYNSKDYTMSFAQAARAVTTDYKRAKQTSYARLILKIGE